MTLTGYQQRNALFSHKVRVSQAADRLIRAMITQLGGTSRYAFDRDVRGTTVGAYDVARRKSARGELTRAPPHHCPALALRANANSKW